MAIVFLLLVPRMSRLVSCCFYLKELDTNLAALTTAFERATAEKVRCQEDVNRTNKTIELANRLVKGLEVRSYRAS